MKNGSIFKQLNMQEKQLSDERKMNTDTQVGMNADVQIGLSADKQENKQESKQENIHSSSQTDLGLSSVFGLFTPDITKEEEQQAPNEKEKKEAKER
jgi:hypothetical protein